MPLPVEEDATVADLGLAPGEPLTVRAVAAAAAAPAPPPPPPPFQQQQPQAAVADTTNGAWAATYGEDVAADEDAALAAAIAASLEEDGGKKAAPSGGAVEYGDIAPAPAPSISGRGDPPRFNRATANGAATAVALPDGTGWLTRRVVAANNSCLFAAVGLLVKGTRDVAADLREVVAAAVLADPETYSGAVLEKPPAEYAAWIRRPKAWGGAIELSILADWARVELAAGDVATSRVDVYGGGKGYAKRGWLIYDGLHYDAVCLVPSTSADPPPLSTRADQGGEGEARDVRTVGVASRQAELAGAAFATLLAGFRAARAFTDTARFTLRCGVCGAGVAGEKEAVAHAKETGHGNFQEY